MTQPTHTHRQKGGRWTAIDSHRGAGPLEGQEVVILHDLDKDVTSVTTYQDWSDNWRQIATDDCTVCLGTGRDSIKGNKRQPCGGCYGLGKVRKDGETPQDMWQLAQVAQGIIQRQHQELGRLRELVALPEVQEIIKAKRDELPDWVQREQQWRGSGGLGHGGRRYTGD